MVRIVLVLIAMTLGGMFVNISSDLRIGQNELLGIAYVWGTFNVLTLTIASLMSLETPSARTQERFPVDIGAALFSNRVQLDVSVHNLSLSGANFNKPEENDHVFKLGDKYVLALDGVGALTAEVARLYQHSIGLKFEPMAGQQRDALIRYLYTSGIDNAPKVRRYRDVSIGLFRRFIQKPNRKL